MAGPTLTGVSPKLELEDIQGLVARGYGNLTAACFVLIAIEEASAARRWLESMVGSITPASERPEEHSLHLAFSSHGLAKLGLDPTVAGGFSAEFVEGMTTSHRRRLLGDIEANAPEGWAWGGPTTPRIDMLLLLYATDANELEALRIQHATRLAARGMRDVATLTTCELDRYEHFGFHDGVSQPIIEGLSKTGPWADTLRAGEFVLGYPNEYGLYTTRPFVSATADPGGFLPSTPSDRDARDLGLNASYLVLRQLRQYVRRFWRYADRAREEIGDGDPTATTRLTAKLVGRWPSGAPLALAPDAENEQLADENDFGYHALDPGGDRCPIGSHIRRANPRDSLEPEPGSNRSIAVGKRHRLLRRGRTYGPRIEVSEALAGDEEPDEERGLHFICLNANIARQFEFIQHTWINDPKFDGLYQDPDPLVGSPSGDGSDRTFTIQGKPVRTRLRGLPEFTSVRGGGYFFLPGIRAVRYLANLGG